ncbi:unnamed protein product [Rhizoctonia solani]|uniref:F-box domain-containing protein n=1 Tax=Rhizoctonia solani TaxID=456999 RepID=A0A8H3AW33_9AGAM|nr:unnamed protein product [Rhizoctonia solani]
MDRYWGLSCPREIWSSIMLFLDAPNLRRCQRVCKLFYRITMDVPQLRFRLELDAAGYVEPTNPRQGLSMGQRLSILREHMSRRRSLIPSRVDVLRNEVESSERLIQPHIQFVGGVYACQSQKRTSDGRHRTALEIVKLPSLNEGTDISGWTIYDEKLDGCNPDRPAAWIHPDWDLLVLLKEVKVNSSTHNSAETVPGYYFYLRTLSTNTTHPDVRQPVLHLNRHPIIPIMSSFSPLEVQLQGPLMLVELHDRGRYRWVVWDWASGAVVFDNNTTSIKYRDIRLYDTLLIAIRRAENESSSSPWFQLPSLDVYSFCPNNNPSMVHVAQMELPKASWEGMHSLISEWGYSAEPAGVSLSFKSNLGVSLRHKPGVFEVPSSARLLEVTVFLQLTGIPIHAPPHYSLSIPLSNILRTQQILQGSTGLSATRSSARVIPWDEWGNEACWTSTQDWPQVMSWVPGPRGIISQLHRHAHNGGRDRTILVIDFQSGLHAYNQFRRDEDNALTPNHWTNDWTPPSSVWDSTLHQWPKHVFPGKLNFQPNYLVAEFKHDILDKLRFERDPHFWMGDEHMIIFEPVDRLSRLGRVFAFTF